MRSTRIERAIFTFAAVAVMTLSAAATAVGVYTLIWAGAQIVNLLTE